LFGASCSDDSSANDSERKIAESLQGSLQQLKESVSDVVRMQEAVCATRKKKTATLVGAAVF
jgi:hypothetical protein